MEQTGNNFQSLPKLRLMGLISPPRVMSVATETKLKRSSRLIFVVDDNRELTEMAEMVLRAEGYKCQAFCDPKDVVEIFRSSSIRPDLLLTDYDMGSMNGLELIDHCRAASPKLKTLLLSGTIEEKTVLRHPVKVDEFLSKPYNPQQLMALVRSLLPD